MNNKLKIVIASIIGIILIFIVASMSSLDKGDKILKAVDERLEMSTTSLLIIGRDDCYYSNQLLPLIEIMSKEQNFDYGNIDTNDLTDRQLIKLLKKLDIDSSEIVTPYMLTMSNGKVRSVLQGYENEKVSFDYLQKNNIISDSASFKTNEDKYQNIKFLNYENYSSAFTEEKQLLIIGQRTCLACSTVKQSANELALEKGIKINYLEINELSNEQALEITDKIDYFKNKQYWPTPLVFLIEDGKIVGNSEGISTKVQLEKIYNKE